MSELKLEVGKRYETRDGRVAFVSFDAGDRSLGVIEGSSGTKIWTQDGCVWGGIQNHHLDLIRRLDDEPELADLTKIDVPFGGLDERTQDRLAGAAARGCAVEFKGQRDGAWQSTSASPSGWRLDFYYRLRPTYTMPTVDDKVWLAMPNIKAIAWAKDSHQLWAYTVEPRLMSSAWGAYGGQGFSFYDGAFGDLIQRGDCPWDQAIVLRPEGL